MGLFDTVLSTDIAPGSYAMAIPAEFKYVAQAIALNEHRGFAINRGEVPDSKGAFPLESIAGSPNPHKHTRIERGFIGSHADIGGGYREGQTQLSQVALDWMLTQAEKAGVKMEQDRDFKTIKADPVLHDKSYNQLLRKSKDERAFPNSKPFRHREDRTVKYANGATTTQMEMKNIAMVHSDTEAFIDYYRLEYETDPWTETDTMILREDHAVGTVDAKAYIAWLNQNGYNIKLKVE